jgi:glyoxylate reductase
MQRVRFRRRNTLEKPTVLIIGSFPPEVDAAFAAGLTVRSAPVTLPAAALPAALAGCDALLVPAVYRVDGAAIRALPDCVRAIATYSVGYDHVDLAAARARGLAVLNTPDVLTDATAETALFLLLGAARRATESIGLIRSRAWKGWSPTQLLGVELAGKALGIFGMGRIGRGIARRARGFGMTIHYSNRNRLSPALEEGAVFHADPEAMLGVVDALALACPSTPQTRGFLDSRRLGLMRRGALVVNIARGDVVVDDDLIDALQTGHIRGAGLDVFTNEPNLHPGYFKLPNLFMLPHIGSSTIEARVGMATLLIDSLGELLAGGAPANNLA